MTKPRLAITILGAAGALGGLAAISSARSTPTHSVTPAVAAASAGALEAKAFVIDGSHSSVLFRVKHLDVTNFWGRFNTVSGAYTLDADNPAASSIRVEIDAESVDSNHEGRDRHLRSPDFFNTGQFPTATFESTTIAQGEGDTLDVRGHLTIRGETRPVRFALLPTGEGDRGPRFGYRGGWETELTISRSDFGIKYLPEGLGDEVKLVIAIEGVGQ